MSLSVLLELVSGGHMPIEMEEPDAFPSSYFISMEHSGNSEFWQVVVKILAAANRSVCKFGSTLRSLGLTRRDITNSAMRNLLQTNGYAFGILREVDSALIDLDLAGHKTFIFVRDPRDVVACRHSAMLGAASTDHAQDADGGVRDRRPVSVLDFVSSPDGDDIARQYRQLADFCRSAKNVTLFRYEDVMFSWREVVAGLIEKLQLKISLESAFEIADSCTVLADDSARSGTVYQGLPVEVRKRLDKSVMTSVEEKFANPMSYFGYVPEASVPVDYLENPAEFLRAISERLAMANAQSWDLVSSDGRASQRVADEQLKTDTKEAMRAQRARIVPGRTAISEADPVLVWRLRANASAEMTVLGRRIVINIDSTGCRSVAGQLETGEKT